MMMSTDGNSSENANQNFDLHGLDFESSNPPHSSSSHSHQQDGEPQAEVESHQGEIENCYLIVSTPSQLVMNCFHYLMEFQGVVEWVHSAVEAAEWLKERHIHPKAIIVEPAAFHRIPPVFHSIHLDSDESEMGCKVFHKGFHKGFEDAKHETMTDSLEDSIQSLFRSTSPVVLLTQELFANREFDSQENEDGDLDKAE
ncbi:MAG: hypothetical protein K2X66_07620 [Cyanobacteria bacterium]|nr:hypothetical protein [Cyanobacteriota bacterium]